MFPLFQFIGCHLVKDSVKAFRLLRTQQLAATSPTLTRCSTFCKDLIRVSWAGVIRLPAPNCRWSLMSPIWQMLRVLHLFLIPSTLRLYLVLARGCSWGTRYSSLSNLSADVLLMSVIDMASSCPGYQWKGLETSSLCRYFDWSGVGKHIHLSLTPSLKYNQEQ